MTLEEAIKHSLKVADEQKKLAEKWEAEGGSQYEKTMACKRCAEEHKQLAEWLRELKDYREATKRMIKQLETEIYQNQYELWLIKTMNKIRSNDGLSDN